MLRALLSPRWLVAHVVVVAVVVGCASLGSWQLRRLEQRRAYNARVAERMAAEPVALGDLLRQGVGPEAAEYRRVSLVGRYLPEDELRLSPRSRDGLPGHHLLTPLRTSDGTVVLVDRGWVPFERPVRAAAPAGPVHVAGLVRTEQERPPFGPAIPQEGRLESVPRVALDRLAAQLPDPLAPVYVQMTEQEPAQPHGFPRPAHPPELDEANHLSYAVQWFLFGLVGVVGYPLLVRQQLSTRQRSAEAVPVG